MRKFLLVCGFLLLLGCSQITSGKIISKNYYPPYDTQETVVVSTIENGDYDIPIYGTETVHHPERCEITIEKEVDGKIIQRTLYIDHTTYDSYNVKDWIELK